MWVTGEVPDRSLGGGNIRQANLLTEVARHLPVDLLVAGELTEERCRSSVRRVIEVPVPERPEPSALTGRLAAMMVLWGRRSTLEAHAQLGARRHLGPALDELAPGYDTVLLHHQGLIPLLPRRRDNRWLLHLFHASAVRARQMAGLAGTTRQRVVLRREATNAARLERTVRLADGLVVVAGEDASAIVGDHPVPVIVAPNGVDLAQYPFTPLPSAPRVVLSASLQYEPNVDGIDWFCREVWPLVRAEVPAATLTLVGRDPVASVRARHGHDGIEVHGDVPEMAPFLARARVAVVPLRIGTGTRLKVLEALASGRPVVGTTIGLAGLGLADGEEARLADDPQSFAAAVVALLRDDAAAERLRLAGRAVVEARFAWERIGRDLARQLEPTVGR
ncbi:glycosyltransferase [soil metagenome]